MAMELEHAMELEPELDPELLALLNQSSPGDTEQNDDDLYTIILVCTVVLSKTSR